MKIKQRIDLSHTIEDGLVTYKGLEAPKICDFWSREKSIEFYENGETFQIDKIEMVGNTGTYLDTPFHRYEDGFDLSELPLEKVSCVEAILIKVIEHLAIDASYFKNIDCAGKAVLIQTNWSKNWNTEAYYSNHPFLTKEAAEFLVKKEVLIVGIDSYNIDNTTESTARPVHSILLANNIPIIEHLTNLNSIPMGETLYFSAVPPKIKKVGTFPVRPYVLTIDA